LLGAGGQVLVRVASGPWIGPGLLLVF
jgi:hypothetical protein